MRFNFDKVLGVHQQAVSLRAKRSELISNNLANADTPNFKARDVDFRSVLDKQVKNASASTMKTTHGSHFNTGANNFGGLPVQYRVPSQPSLDGNTVDVQLERTEFAENAVQHQASLMFLGRRFKGLIGAFRGE